MLKCPTYEFIPVENAIVDEEYWGYKTFDYPNCESICLITYKGNGTGLIFNDQEREVVNISFLKKKLSFTEQEKWRQIHYNIKNPREQINLMGLYNDMYDIGDAYHEMYNAWIAADWYEMSENLQNESFFLIGIAPAPWDCWSILNPVALVIEEEDGTRLWCHAGLNWIKQMRNQMLPIYNNMMGIEE